jgi:hypothetical protein
MKKRKKSLLELYKKAEKVLTREKAQKVIKKFDKKVRGESYRGSGANTPKPPAETEKSTFL